MYNVMPLSCFDDKTPLLSGSKGLGGLTNYVTATTDVKPVPGCSSWYPLLETSRWANKTLDGRRHHRLLEESLRADLTDLKDPDTINLREPAIDTEAEPGTGEQTQPPGETNVATTSHPPVPDLGGGNGGAPELRQRPRDPLEMTPTEAKVLPRAGYGHSLARERKEENASKR